MFSLYFRFLQVLPAIVIEHRRRLILLTHHENDLPFHTGNFDCVCHFVSIVFIFFPSNVVKLFFDDIKKYYEYPDSKNKICYIVIKIK